MTRRPGAVIEARGSAEDREQDRSVGYRFDRFLLRERPLELLADGEPVGLQPQPARALRLLVDRAGSLVRREELRDELWEPGTHLDHDQGINFAIRKIREALGDDPQRPRYLETVPRRGYRFVADVERDASQSSPSSGRPADRSRRRRVAATLAAALLSAAGAIGWILAPQAGRHEPAPPLPLPSSEDVPAPVRESYLEARYLVSQSDPGPIARGTALLEDVVLAAPESGAAHLALAQGRIKMGGDHLRDFLVPAAAAARRAVELDPSLARGWCILATRSLFSDLDGAATAAYVARALRLDPELAPAHHLRGLYLSAIGRHDAAVDAIRRAVELDPEELFIASDLAETLFRARRWGEAVEQSRRLLAVDPTAPSSHWIAVDSLLRLGDEAQAMVQVSTYYRSRDLAPPPNLPATLEGVFNYLERQRQAGHPQLTAQARFAHSTGRDELAIALLQASCREPDWETAFLAVSPRFDGLRDHPGWLGIPCLFAGPSRHEPDSKAR